jgi:hypothetical protein
MELPSPEEVLPDNQHRGIPSPEHSFLEILLSHRSFPDSQVSSGHMIMALPSPDDVSTSPQTTPPATPPRASSSNCSAGAGCPFRFVAALVAATNVNEVHFNHFLTESPLFRRTPSFRHDYSPHDASSLRGGGTYTVTCLFVEPGSYPGIGIETRTVEWYKAGQEDLPRWHTITSSSERQRCTFLPPRHASSALGSPVPRFTFEECKAIAYSEGLESVRILADILECERQEIDDEIFHSTKGF